MVVICVHSNPLRFCKIIYELRVNDLGEIEESQKMIELLGERKNKEKVLNMIKNGFMEENSFLEPVTSEMCRTSKAVPHKGVTSVTRIAKD